MDIKKRFKRKDIEFGVGYICPYCNQVFGLDVDFLMSVKDSNIHFNCPYCGKDGGIENE